MVNYIKISHKIVSKSKYEDEFKEASLTLILNDIYLNQHYLTDSMTIN